MKQHDMRGRVLTSAIAVVALVFGSACQAQPAHSEHAAEPATKPAAHAAVDLERSMKAMERSLKQLERQVKDESQYESSLRVVTELQQHALTAKSGVPHTPDNLTHEQKAAAVVSYRRRMGIVLQYLVDLETAILDKNQKKIADTLTAIHNTENAGHEEFNVKEH